MTRFSLTKYSQICYDKFTMKNKNSHTFGTNPLFHAYKFVVLPSQLMRFVIIGVFIILTILTISALTPTRAQTVSTVLKPTHDGFVYKYGVNNNYGKDIYLKSHKDAISYLKFNLGTISESSVGKAELRFFVTNSSAATFYLKLVNNTSWSENTLTYNNKPARTSPAIAGINNTSAGAWKTVDITNTVRTNAGKLLSLAVENPTTSDNLYFYSKDNADRKPEIVIYQTTTTSPTPRQAATATPTKVPTRVPTATQAPQPPGAATYPSQVLNLAAWKLTLPSGSAEDPTEIKQPELTNYMNDPWFVVTGGNAVRFRAPVNGVTTNGSDYPRSELREMTSDGEDGASWSSTSGTHTMFLDQAITAVPQTKKHVVAGQIHDSSDDVIVIRLEYPKLFIDVNGEDGPTLDANYTLGKRFNVKFEVSNGQTRIYYNNSASPVFTHSQSYSGAYFKAGAYTQSNCDRESSCSSSNFGEVVIYKATVSHQ